MRARNGRVHGAGPDRRRRSIVLSIGLLTLLSMSPILGHHLAGSLDGLLAGTDHLGALCLIALRALLAPVHDIFHVLLAAGVAYASWERVRANHLLRKTISSVTWKPPAPGGAIEAAAEAVAVDPARVQVARGLPVPAFTAGWLRPRIYLAAELADRLSPQELAAVLAHEGAHAARRDPLCLSVLRFLGNALFWIPVLRKLAEDCADEVEFRADDDACRGSPTPWPVPSSPPQNGAPPAEAASVSASTTPTFSPTASADWREWTSRHGVTSPGPPSWAPRARSRSSGSRAS